MISHLGRKLDGVLKSPQQREQAKHQPSNVTGELMTFNSAMALICCTREQRYYLTVEGFINRVSTRSFVSQLEPHSFFSPCRSVDR